MGVTQAKETGFTRFLKSIPKWFGSRESSGRSARVSSRPTSSSSTRPSGGGSSRVSSGGSSRVSSRPASAAVPRRSSRPSGQAQPTSINPNATNVAPGRASGGVNAEALRKKIDGVTGNGGSANKANILKWQQWYNDKHPNSPIKADGILGRQTLAAMGLRSSA